MSTGLSDWVNLDRISAIYPFAGAEWLFVLAAVIFWIWWHVKAIRQENQEMEEARNHFRKIGLDKAMDPEGKARLPENRK